MAHLDSFLREIQALDAERTLTISSQELPGIETWQNGDMYDITITYRGAMQMQKISNGSGIIAVMKLKNNPIYEAMPSNATAMDYMRKQSPKV